MDRSYNISPTMYLTISAAGDRYKLTFSQELEPNLDSVVSATLVKPRGTVFHLNLHCVSKTSFAISTEKHSLF